MHLFPKSAQASAPMWGLDSSKFHAELPGLHFHERGTLNSNMHVVRWHGQDCPDWLVVRGPACKAPAALVPTYAEGRLSLHHELQSVQSYQPSELLHALRQLGGASAAETNCCVDADDLEALMGYPRGYTALLSHFSHRQRVSLLSTAVHVPALAMCLSALLSNLPLQPEPAWSIPWEPWQHLQTSLVEGPSAMV